MSAIFDGSTSILYHLNGDLVASGSSPTYPIMMGGWSKVANTTAAMVGMYLGDNASSGYDFLEHQFRGDQPSDPLMSQAAHDGGGTTLSQKTGLVASTWQHTLSYFGYSNNRQSAINGVFGAVGSVEKLVDDLSVFCIGARYWDDAPSFFYTGRMAEVFTAYGFDPDDVAGIATKLAAGWKPMDIAELAPYITMYHALLDSANSPDSVGLEVIEVGMTYDDEDHPTMLASLTQNTRNLLYGGH